MEAIERDIERFLAVSYGSGSGSGSGYGDGYGDGVKELSGHKVYNIDRVQTLIYSVKGDAARGAVLRMAGDVTFCSRAVGETRPNGLEDGLEFHGLMPSPVAQDYRRRGPNSRQQGLPEVCHRLLHTPIADGLKKRTVKGQKRMSAEDFEAMFPGNGGSPASKDGRASQLNPLFVGEMMGYPLEWLTSPFLSGDGEGRP